MAFHCQNRQHIPASISQRCRSRPNSSEPKSLLPAHTLRSMVMRILVAEAPRSPPTVPLHHDPCRQCLRNSLEKSRRLRRLLLAHCPSRPLLSRYLHSAPGRVLLLDPRLKERTHMPGRPNGRECPLAPDERLLDGVEEETAMVRPR